MRSFKAFGVQGGAWHHGWKWKMWLDASPVLGGEIGLGRVWVYIGRLSFAADRAQHGMNDHRDASLELRWRLSPRSGRKAP